MISKHHAWTSMDDPGTEADYQWEPLRQNLESVSFVKKYINGRSVKNKMFHIVPTALHFY